MRYQGGKTKTAFGIAKAIKAAIEEDRCSTKEVSIGSQRTSRVESPALVGGGVGKLVLWGLLSRVGSRKQF